jgi:cytochrome c5
MIDRVNPFDAAYAVLAKAMDEKILKQVAATIAAKRVNLSYEEARDLALRALKFKQERGRAPEITAQDAWEKRLAEGVAALARYRAQAVNG